MFCGRTQNNYRIGLLPSVADGQEVNMKFKKKQQIELTEEQKEEIRIKDFFDRILPSTIKFSTDHYIIGDSYRCVWAIKEYPPTTEELALFSQLADRNNAVENITAEGNLQDVVTLIAELRKNKEPLLHCAVYLELKAESMQKLRELQSDIIMELTRSKMSVDRLTLRQKEGFLSVLPCGTNIFNEQFERVLPASSVANLYPFNYSGKTDPKGFFIGRDKYGTNILVDFDRRADDKTNANCLILGNSGQGKSFLMKLILTNLRESGKRIISLDPEAGAKRRGIRVA